MNALAGALAASLTLVAALSLRAAVGFNQQSAARQRLRRDQPVEGVARPRRLPPPPPALARLLDGAALPVDATTTWVAWLVALGLAGPAGLFVAGPGLALVAVLVVAATPVVVLPVVAGRSDRLVEDGLPDALESIARSLRSGASLRQAIDETAETCPGLLGRDIATVSCDVDQGRVLSDALDDWGRRRELPGVRLAVSALALGAETGGAHARAIDGVAATVRSRQGVNREVRALSSQARLSGIVIILAPLGFSALAAATDERTAGFLLGTPFGLVCLVVGLALDGAAAVWMSRLSRIDI